MARDRLTGPVDLAQPYLDGSLGVTIDAGGIRSPVDRHDEVRLFRQIRSGGIRFTRS
jgi:hypothetical protein